ncbi:MAG: M20/M25/M40 family metallo-hydrolase [Spirochaetota bacterium]|nr:MAG: M20/M25/M40 family metallo-hydrolase [Spirochaetota bacterium]
MSRICRDTICSAVEKHKDDIVDWTKTLIRFASENRPPTGSEGEAQEFFASEVKQCGWEIDMFRPDEPEGIKDHPVWLKGRDYSNNRKNVVATWKGKGSAPSILFSGHMDVAPYEPDNWKICRPYEPVVKDGRLYGRGSSDMKGGIASFFWSLKILKELGFEPEGDIIFESIVDEEFAGGNGTLASRLKGYNADLAILTEPTRMEVCTASLGAFLGDLIIKGKGGMPYMGTSIPNPISGAARIIDLFSEWQDLWRGMNVHPLFTEPGKELNVILWNIDSKVPDEFTQLGTPLITKISWVTWCYPGMTEREFYQHFEKFWNDHVENDPRLKPFEIEIIPTFHYVKAWETDSQSHAVKRVVDIMTEYTGERPKVGGASISCDLAIYGENGNMPAVIIGPRGDNLHAPDEWVLIEDIFTLTGIFALLAASWCG